MLKMSQKLKSISVTLHSASENKTQREAANDLYEALQNRASREACLRCEKAGWLIGWNDSSNDPSKHTWGLTLSSCGAFQILPQHPGGFGLITPDYFFCTAESHSESE